MAELFSNESEFDDAHAHIEQAKLHVDGHTYDMGRAMELQAQVWYQQHRLKEARSEALCAFETYERLGAANDLEHCETLLHTIGQATKNWPASGEQDFDGRPLVVSTMDVNLSFLSRGAAPSTSVYSRFTRLFKR